MSGRSSATSLSGALRRSKLRSRADRGSRRAKKALRRLRRYEDNFVTTRCWQVAHEIVAIAGEYNAYIAIEDLKHLNRARGNRRGNRKAKRMPYRKFRVALESVGGQKHRLVESVYPRGTSHICSRCGSVGTRTKPVFRCPGCGNVVNDDRNASVNIAIRAGLKRPGFFRDSDTAQYPGGNLPVNARTRAHDGVGLWCLQHVNHLRGTPTASAVGS
jgi:IS605 OrfB family transposase